MKRKILDEVRSRRPGCLLYHYTQQKGLMGIIHDAQIWATHTQYLNDHREYLHAADMVRDRIRAIDTSGDARLKSILRDMEIGVDGIETMNVCVSSFSTNGDSLSQWRAYGGAFSGYSIGFCGDFLADTASQANWYLAPCIYDPQTQSDLISSLVDEVIEENIARKQTASEEENPLPPGGNLAAYLHRYAPILKDYSFHEEQEWRLISRPRMCSSEAFSFREGSSMLIPYYKFQLAPDPASLNIHEVVVGPTPHPNQSSMSMRSFLVKNRLRNTSIVESKVPYRSW